MSTQRNPNYGENEMPVSMHSTYYDVTITKVTNGFIVRVGCMTFVDKDWKTISIKLGEYWKDPVAAREKYASNKLDEDN